MTKTSRYQGLLAALAGALATTIVLLGVVDRAEAERQKTDGDIAFTSDRTEGEGVRNPSGDSEIFTIRPDGTGLRQLTYNEDDDYAPDYSSDGERITFSSDRDGGDFFVLDIFKMKSDGSGQENLTETPGAVETFSAWSPDGGRIAFDSDRANPFSGNEDIFGMRSDGSGQEKLSGTPAADDYAPSWQPGEDDDDGDDD